MINVINLYFKHDMIICDGYIVSHIDSLTFENYEYASYVT